jgi:hypothetical protein
VAVRFWLNGLFGASISLTVKQLDQQGARCSHPQAGIMFQTRNETRLVQ